MCNAIHKESECIEAASNSAYALQIPFILRTLFAIKTTYHRWISKIEIHTTVCSNAMLLVTALRGVIEIYRRFEFLVFRPSNSDCSFCISMAYDIILSRVFSATNQLNWTGCRCTLADELFLLITRELVVACVLQQQQPKCFHISCRYPHYNPQATKSNKVLITKFFQCLILYLIASHKQVNRRHKCNICNHIMASILIQR